MNLLNDTFIVKYDDDLKSLLIIHPDEKLWPEPVIRIREETLATLDFLQASQFVGERIFLLIPQLRTRYEADLARLAAASDRDSAEE